MTPAKKKVKLNKFHLAMKCLVEGYLSAINLNEFLMDEETIRNCPVLPGPETNQGVRFIADVNGKVVVDMVHRRKGCTNFTRIHDDLSWSIKGGPGRHLRMVRFRTALKDFWNELEGGCLKRLPKKYWPSFGRNVITGVEDFSKFAEERFRIDHKLEIMVTETMVVINGRYYDMVLGWRKLR